MGNRGPQIQAVMPLTPMVKKLVIINVAIWVGLQVILDQMILPVPYVAHYFSFSPLKVVRDFFIWEPFSYMFLHSTSSPWHILFNMLILWWLGSELETRWGKRFFLTYYLVCGVGAAVLYTIFVFAFSILTGMLAYGIIFGERVVYFMFLFAMKAKYMVAILAALEIFTILTGGLDGGRETSNLAHVFGLLSGFLFLSGWTRWQKRKAKKTSSKWGRNLRLVVNNDELEKKDPKYWN
jgi:membrane associated rhomboid family serine protease